MSSIFKSGRRGKRLLIAMRLFAVEELNDSTKAKEGMLKVMEKIAKKAKPREGAAELVRRFRDTRRW